MRTSQTTDSKLLFFLASYWRFHCRTHSSASSFEHTSFSDFGFPRRRKAKLKGFSKKAFLCRPFSLCFFSRWSLLCKAEVVSCAVHHWPHSDQLFPPCSLGAISSLGLTVLSAICCCHLLEHVSELWVPDLLVNFVHYLNQGFYPLYCITFEDAVKDAVEVYVQLCTPLVCSWRQVRPWLSLKEINLWVWSAVYCWSWMLHLVYPWWIFCYTFIFEEPACSAATYTSCIPFISRHSRSHSPYTIIWVTVHVVHP